MLSSKMGACALTSGLALGALACSDDDDPVQGGGCIAGYQACGQVCVPIGTCQIGTGGTVGSGGTVTGGTVGSGGSTPPPTSTCNDSATASGAITSYFGSESIPTGTGKSYYLHANWWGRPSIPPQINYTGLSFAINTNIPHDGDYVPAGYPSLYIGSYQGRSTTGSNLPIPVSAISRIPTTFQTNVLSLDTANFNAAYDVWFTASSAPLANNATNPGAGGAFLMVWLYKPANHRPVGGTASGARPVAGVDGTWDVWFGDNQGVPVVSYVAKEPLWGIETDLNYFIQDAVANGLGVTASQHLSVIFAGFEVWSGAQGASVNHFCVDVQ